MSGKDNKNHRRGNPGRSPAGRRQRRGGRRSSPQEDTRRRREPSPHEEVRRRRARRDLHPSQQSSPDLSRRIPAPPRRWVDETQSQVGSAPMPILNLGECFVPQPQREGQGQAAPVIDWSVVALPDWMTSRTQRGLLRLLQEQSGRSPSPAPASRRRSRSPPTSSGRRGRTGRSPERRRRSPASRRRTSPRTRARSPPVQRARSDRGHQDRGMAEGRAFLPGSSGVSHRRSRDRGMAEGRAFLPGSSGVSHRRSNDHRHRREPEGTSRHRHGNQGVQEEPALLPPSRTVRITTSSMEVTRTIQQEDSRETTLVTPSDPTRRATKHKLECEDGGASAAKQRRSRPCIFPDCSVIKTYPKLHDFNYHIPTIFSDTLIPEDVARERAAALQLLTSLMCGTRANIHDLGQLVTSGNYLDRCRGVEIKETHRRSIIAVSRELDLSPPDTFSLMPLSSPAVLSHWRAILELVARLTKAKRVQFYACFPPRLYQPPPLPATAPAPAPDHPAADGHREADAALLTSPPPQRQEAAFLLPTSSRSEEEPVLAAEMPPLELISTQSSPLTQSEWPSISQVNSLDAFDSHFHLDRSVASHMKTPGLSFTSTADPSWYTTLCQVKPPMPLYNVNLVGAVANFCDPLNWPSPDFIGELRGLGVRVTIGIHPKKVPVTKEDWAQFTELVKEPNVSGIGEIGLDDTKYSPPLWQQQAALDNLLPLVTDKDVVVVHCRGSDVLAVDSLYLTMLSLLRVHLSARPDARIHLHCFTGTQFVVNKYLAIFRNTYFSFSKLVQTYSPEQVGGLRRVPEERLLLETDSPHFKVGGKPSSPSLVGVAAAEVAKVLNKTPKWILALSTINAVRLYPL